MAIHSTVPGIKKGNPYVIARRLRLIAHQITGRANAMTSAKLARLCGIEPSATNQSIRAGAKILLVEEHVPIVSCSAGFYIATEAKELLDYKQNLVSRMIALERDIVAVNTILQRRGKEQKEMFE